MTWKLATMPQTWKENQEGLHEIYYSHCSYRGPTQPVPAETNPRSVLKRASEAAAQLGFVYQIGPEVEFFLFRTDTNGKPALVPHDVAGYFDATTDAATHVRRRMVRALAAFGIEVEQTHHEGALGQHEIDLRYGPALRTADNTVTVRVLNSTGSPIDPGEATWSARWIPL